MRYLLDTVYLTLIVAASPWLAYASLRRGKYRQGLPQKLFGQVPQLRLAPSKRRVWFHAVSVGEVNLLDPIVGRLTSTVPDVEVIISSTTNTGYGLARRKYPEHVIFYCPLDFSWAVRRAIRRLKPDLLVLVELELWPNLLMELKKQDIPVAIVNGRLSDHSAKGYARLGPLMRSWMRGVALVAAQGQTCAERFMRLGVPAERVHAVGSVKFDGAETCRDNSCSRALSQLACIKPDEIVFVAGSTQAPEEAMTFSVFQRLSVDFPELRLVIVPRHPERADEIASLLDSANASWARRSQVAEPASSSKQVWLVDTIGELSGWWGLAHIGFVGGSMGSRGGQNMLEPSGFGVATCFGPHTRNFRDVVDMLRKADAARVVYDEESLYEFVRSCLLDEDFRAGLGQRAKELVISHRGAATATVQLLVDLMDRERVAFRHHGEAISKHAAGSQEPRRRSA